MIVFFSCCFAAGFETLVYASVPTRMRPSSGTFIRPKRANRMASRSSSTQEEDSEIFEDTSVIPPWDSKSLNEDSESSGSSRNQGLEWRREELRPRPASAKLLREVMRHDFEIATQPAQERLPRDYVPHPVLDRMEKDVMAQLGQAHRNQVNLDDYRRMSYKAWEKVQGRHEPAVRIDFLQSYASTMFDEDHDDNMHSVHRSRKGGWRQEVSTILREANEKCLQRGHSRTNSQDGRPPAYGSAASSHVYTADPAQPVVFKHMMKTGRIPKQLSSVAKRLLTNESGGKSEPRYTRSGQHSSLSASRRPGSAKSHHSNASSRPSSAISSTPSRPNSAASRPQTAMSDTPARSRVGSRPSSAASNYPPSPAIQAFPADLEASNTDKTVISIQDSTVKFIGFRGENSSQGPHMVNESDAVPGIFNTLKSSPLMRGLGDLAVRLLSRDCTTVTMPPGTTVCSQGSRGKHAYVLAEGQLSVFYKGDKDSDQEQVGHLHLTGDCVGEITLLVGVPYPTTVRTVTSCHLVKVPVSALHAVLRQWPSTAQIFAECLAHQRRLEKLEKHADQPASILIKVLGMKDLKKVRGLAIRPTLQVTLKTQDGNETLSRPLEDLTASFSELPVNQLFEFSVLHSDSEVVVSVLHRGKAGEEPLQVGSASFPFQSALQARTMSATLELDQGGTVSVLVSVRGMYTMQEMQLIEWLDKNANDLPMLLKCGVRSVEDLADLSHNELLRAMETNRLGTAMKERIAKLVHKAKSGGGFLGKDARALSAHILRYYKMPAVATQEPPTRAPMVAQWENELFVKYLVPSPSPGTPSS